MRGFVLAGVNSNVGKTTITLGIMKAFTDKGYKVQGFKVGPDYIDPAFHTHVTGRYSRNLDSYLVDEDYIRYLYYKNSIDADISIIEGVMGMYDGFSGDSELASTAHIAKILDLPVVLILDGSGIAASSAAIVKGFIEFDKDVKIEGVIINKVHGEKHYNILKTAIEKYTNVKCLGYVNSSSDIVLKSRHLGLIPSVEVKELNKKLEKIASMVLETVNLDKLKKLSYKNLIIEESYVKLKNEIKKYHNLYEGINVYIAYDSAFNFYYRDNLNLMEYMGANIKYFSPIKDKEILDDVDIIYLGGGFPEVFAKELSLNVSMLKSIKNHFNNGVIIYAECGGLMYLGESIVTLEKEEFKMCKVLSGKATMTNRLQRFGYVEVNTTQKSIIGDVKFRAHEFHRSVFDSEEKTVFDVVKRRENGASKWKCGFVKNNLLASYSHVHFYSNIEILNNLLKTALERKKYNEK